MLATGAYEGRDAQHPEVRAMFTRESLLGSEWYRQRLRIKQHRDAALWKQIAPMLRELLD